MKRQFPVPDGAGDDPRRIDTTADRSAFEPTDWLTQCAAAAGTDVPRLPRLGVQILMRQPFADCLGRFGATPHPFEPIGHPFALVDDAPEPFVIGWSAKGSGAAGGVEELIAMGVERLVVLGGAGDISGELAVGDVVVASAALRDDGVSGHYQSEGRYAHPSASLTESLAEAIDGRGVPVATGAVWSMTAYFRQTPARVRACRDDGCVAVCNEAAAAFAVGRYRHVEVAAAFVIGDSIADGTYRLDGDPDPGVVPAMVDAALEALGTRAPGG